MPIFIRRDLRAPPDLQTIRRERIRRLRHNLPERGFDPRIDLLADAIDAILELLEEDSTNG